jgi:hypothetical protein
MNGASKATRFHDWDNVPPPVAHVNWVMQKLLVQ